METQIDSKETIELPKNISLRNNKYQVRLQFNNSSTSKTFKTLKEAIEFKENYLNQSQEENKRLHYLKPITYTNEGIAYINIEYKKGNKEYQCLVDEDKWHELTFMKTWFRNPNGYIKSNINEEPTLIHRYLYETYKPNENISDLQIDHKNRNKLDNRMSNLRAITSGKNNHNQIVKNKYGYKGVKKNKNSNRYCARIKHEGNEYYSKYFDTIEEAALAYNELSLQYYGDDFELLNIISSN